MAPTNTRKINSPTWTDPPTGEVTFNKNVLIALIFFLIYGGQELQVTLIASAIADAQDVVTDGKGKLHGKSAMRRMEIGKGFPATDTETTEQFQVFYDTLLVAYGHAGIPILHAACRIGLSGMKDIAAETSEKKARPVTGQHVFQVKGHLQLLRLETVVDFTPEKPFARDRESHLQTRHGTHRPIGFPQ